MRYEVLGECDMRFWGNAIRGSTKQKRGNGRMRYEVVQKTKSHGRMGCQEVQYQTPLDVI
jgi:hypothetical protein